MPRCWRRMCMLRRDTKETTTAMGPDHFQVCSQEIPCAWNYLENMDVVLLRTKLTHHTPTSLRPIKAPSGATGATWCGHRSHHHQCLTWPRTFRRHCHLRTLNHLYRLLVNHPLLDLTQTTHISSLVWKLPEAAEQSHCQLDTDSDTDKPVTASYSQYLRWDRHSSQLLRHFSVYQLNS